MQTREQIYQAAKNYQALDLRQREQLREMRLRYKQTIVAERSFYQAARAKSIHYPAENISIIIDGATQEG